MATLFFRIWTFQQQSSKKLYAISTAPTLWNESKWHMKPVFSN